MPGQIPLSALTISSSSGRPEEERASNVKVSKSRAEKRRNRKLFSNKNTKKHLMILSNEGY